MNKCQQINANTRIFDKTRGEGSYGTVYDGEYRSDINNPYKPVCIKHIEKKGDDQNRKIFENEIIIIKKLNEIQHPNLVLVYDIIERETDAYIVMEQCERDLENHFWDKQSQLTNEEIKQIVIDILAGYKVLQGLSIVHRDLKLQNILVKDGKFKVIDRIILDRRFWTRQVFIVERLKSPLDKIGNYGVCGTTTLHGRTLLSKGRHVFSKFIKYKQLGVIVYRLMFNQFPHQEDELSEQRDRVLSSKNNPIKCPNIGARNPTMMKLVEQMLRYREADRPLWNQLFYTDGLTKEIAIKIL